MALPVTVPGDVVLVRQQGVLASVGALCVYPAGFEFYLTIALDAECVPERAMRFHGHSAEDRASATRVRVGFSDGRAADSVDQMARRVVAGEVVLRFAGGDSGISNYRQVSRCESRWWVSPLPPPGQVWFEVLLHGPTEFMGSGQIDAEVINEAAKNSERLWPLAVEDAS